MSGQARVGSIEKLKEFRVALCKFSDTVSTALEEAITDIHRTGVWLEQSQFTYWKSQYQKCNEKYIEAQLALKRRQQMENSPGGGHYSYVDERKAVASAQRKLEEAEAKIKNIKRWIPLLKKEALAYRGLAQGLATMIEAEIPNARSGLDNMINSLESYMSLKMAGKGGELSIDEIKASMTRAGIEFADMESQNKLPEKYRQLRALTPIAAEREMFEVDAAQCQWIAGGDVRRQLKKIIKKERIKIEETAGELKVIIAKVNEPCGQYYLERIRCGAPGDSGWYVGPAAGAAVEGYQAITVGDLVELKPAWRDIVSLPVGSLIAIDGDLIEALIDPADNLVYESERDK